MNYADIWADISYEEVSKLFKDLEKMWERWNVNNIGRESDITVVYRVGAKAHSNSSKT